MTLQVIVSSRALYAVDTYVGDKGRIFYRESVGDLRLSDGITPGGIPLTGNSVTLIGDTEPLNPSSGTLWFNPATNQLKIYFDDDSSGWVDIAGSLQGLTSNNQSILSVDAGYDIIPAVDAGPSLGTPQKRFKSLHLSGNSLYIDDVRVTVNQNSELMVFDSQDNLTSIHSKEIYLGDQSDPIVLRKNDLTDRLEMVLYSGTVSEEVYSVSIGYTGSQGEIGYTGSQGIVGFTGSAGGGPTNLIFTEDSNTARLTSYRSDSGDTFTVRTAQIDNGTFVLNLAAFTPTLAGAVQPAASLNWDVAATGFRVDVTNPTDFTTRYISSVRSITQISGSVSTDLSGYTTAGPSNTPDGGVSWTQTFSVNNSSSYIRSTSTTIAGGTASATVRFNETTTPGQETEFVDGSATWTVNWITPTISCAVNSLSGNTFLQTYTSTAYTISVTGITNSQNRQHTVTGNNGTVTNASGNGNLTFTAPIHKNNTGVLRSVSVSTVFTRPQSVTGNSYTATLTADSAGVSASFSYPSFWLFTASVAEPPTREVIVNGAAYRSGVTTLTNATRVFSASVSNSQNVPRVFWLGVRTAAQQPTSFRTGASSALLSDVVPTTATVQLAPDVVPQGYLNESFSLYGIILQPGSTFISIG